MKYSTVAQREAGFVLAIAALQLLCNLIPFSRLTKESKTDLGS